MCKLFSLLTGIVIFSFAASANATALGTKSYLVVKRGIEVPAHTTEPMYIARNPKTGKRKFVSSAQSLDSTCMINFVQSDLSDIVLPSSTISITERSSGRSDDLSWTYMKLTYSTPIESIHCYRQGGLISDDELNDMLAPYFEFVAD
jgi:hypothetical protein